VGVLRYLSRMTRIFGAASLGVLLFGIIAGQSLHEMTKTWVTASMTLFVVALVLLLLIMRDQHRAIVAVEGSLAAAAEAPPGAPVARAAGAPTAAAGAVPEGAEPTAADVEPAPAVAAPAGATATATAARVNVATVERGRIASLAGVVSLIWLVILVLMVWQP
jgi:predicted lipid-binding transport protein (Tim44 family)